MTDATQLRIIIAILGALLLAGMYFWGQPKKPKQGSRTAGPKRAAAGERVEPVLGVVSPPADPAGLDPELELEIDRLGAELAAQRGGSVDVDTPPPPSAAIAPPPQRSSVGARGDAKIDRIVTLYVAARPGETIGGPELVVAAEKAGLEFGDHAIFHRLVEGKPEQGPVFSVANMVKPGSFDLSQVATLRTPGLTVFMTLPGPIPALDAWDTMFPAAQRLAELLDAQVLDANHNAIGRQTIQHVRDDLRAWDRQRERNVIRKSW
jgi:cell division protein ZipA